MECACGPLSVPRAESQHSEPPNSRTTSTEASMPLPPESVTPTHATALPGAGASADYSTTESRPRGEDVENNTDDDDSEYCALAYSVIHILRYTTSLP